MSFFIATVVRVSAIVAMGLVATTLMRRQSAASRHSVLTATVLLAAITPLLTLALPAWTVVTFDAAPAPPATLLDGNVVIDSTGTGVPTATSTSAKPLPVWLPATAWLTGTTLCLIALLAGTLRLSRIASTSRPVGPGAWTDLTRGIAASYGLTRFVRLLQSRNPSILVTWGALRPKVLLPEGASDWNADRVRVVLSHELAHIRRHDWLVQMTAELLRSIYWFNPLVWFLCNRLHLESELSCDDAALAQGIDGTDYASHLLELARDLNRPNRSWSAALAMARPSTVERRFKAMLNSELNRRPLTHRAMIVVATLALAIVLPIATLNSQTPATGRISGTVSDSAGAKIANATVIVSTPDGRTEMTGTTTATGGYSFAGLSEGQHVVQVFATGFGASRMLNVAVKNGANAQQDVRMDIGFVRTPEGTQPRTVAVAPKVIVSPSPLRPEIVKNISTRDQGVRVSENSGQAGIVSGTVVDQRGVPVVGAVVSTPVVQRGDNTIAVNFQKATTDSRGVFQIAGLAPGVLAFQISQPGFRTLIKDNVNVSTSAVTLDATLAIGAISEVVTITPSTKAGARAPAKRVPVRDPNKGQLQPPIKLEDAIPEYPADLAAQGVTGAVVLEASVDEEGIVTDIRILASANRGFIQPALDAVKRWRFAPTLLDGEPVRTMMTVTLNFALN